MGQGGSSREISLGFEKQRGKNRRKLPFLARKTQKAGLEMRVWPRVLVVMGVGPGDRRVLQKDWP